MTFSLINGAISSRYQDITSAYGGLFHGSACLCNTKHTLLWKLICDCGSFHFEASCKSGTHICLSDLYEVMYSHWYPTPIDMHISAGNGTTCAYLFRCFRPFCKLIFEICCLLLLSFIQYMQPRINLYIVELHIMDANLNNKCKVLIQQLGEKRVSFPIMTKISNLVKYLNRYWTMNTHAWVDSATIKYFRQILFRKLIFSRISKMQSSVSFSLQRHSWCPKQTALIIPILVCCCLIAPIYFFYWMYAAKDAENRKG